MKTKILLLSMTLVLGIFNQQVKADIIKKIGSSDGGVSKASGADFKSLGEAISAINTNTGNVYSGAVSLQVIDNTYDASQLTINPSLGIKTISPTLGSGYVAPVVTINGGTRTTVGNLVTTVINGMVTNITMTGGAWTVAPTSVTIADPVGGGTTAIVTGAYISGSQVVFPITNCGTGYGPVATFVGGGGSGASLETKILTSATAPGATPATVALAIALACPGSGYTSTPTISFSSGGSGSGAAATVTAIHPSTYSSINIYPTVTGKSIGANFAGSLIFLGGTTNLTIDGRLHNSDGSLNGSTRDLTITNPSVYKDAYTIRIDGGSKNNTIKYCTIKGSSTVNYRGTIGIYVFGNNNNTISNNLFTNSDGSNRPVNSIHAVGSGAFPNTNNTISNNEFADFVSPLLGGSAINIGAENNAWTITGNSFYELNASPNAASSSYSIISISNLAATGFVITDNYIGGSAANCGGTAWTKSNAGNNTFTGIYLNVGGMPACSVQNNTIKNISWSNSAAAAFTGINYTGSAMDIGTTTGNTIGATTGTGSIVYMAGTTGNSNILFTGINIVNKGTGGYCSNNKIGSITAGNSTNTLTYVVGIFNNLSSGTSYINNNTIGSSSTASSINASSTAASQILFGIQSNSSGTSTYSGNIISNISNATTGAGGNTYGFSTSGGTNTINGNYINNLSCPNSTSAFPSTIIGIYVGTSAASSTYTYTNNIISLVDITPCTVYGIFEQNTTSTGFTNFYYNTIYLGGTQASGSGTQSFCFRSTNNTTNLRDIRNNIFVNARSTTGVSSKHNAFYYGVVPAANTITCDYNAYWFSGTAGYLGTFNGAYPSVLPLVTGQIGNDAHSFKIDPLFTNAGGTNAVDYIPSPTVTTLTAVTGTGINTDYAGNTRATPKMGAFESSYVSTAQNISGLTLTVNSALTVLNGGHLTINESKTLNNITVERGGKLTNASGQTLTLTTLNLKSDASGTATYVDNGTSAITTGNVQQYLTGGRNWYISSPVASAARNVITNATTVYKFNEPTLAWQTESTSISPKLGYIAATTSTGTVTFTGGALNTGSQTLNNLSWSAVDATKKGFNLIGNPYPSYLDWEQTTKTGLSTTMWYRSRNAGNTAYVFDTYNGTSQVGTSLNGSTVTRYIPPMQAFWVRATSATNTFTATNAMRSHESGTNRLKAKAVDSQQVLRLQVSNNVNYDETLVLFNQNALNGFDDFDSPKMSNNTTSIPEIYTQIGDQKLVMNGMNAVKFETEIPLGFTTGEANNFSVKNTQMTNFDVGTKIILKDKLLNTENDLTEGTPYTFESGVTNTTNRFSLIFRAPGVATGVNPNAQKLNAQVYVNAANQITIIAPEKAKYSIYNALGQIIKDGITSSNRTIVTGINNSGIFVVRVSENGSSYSTRIVLNCK